MSDVLGFLDRLAAEGQWDVVTTDILEPLVRDLVALEGYEGDLVVRAHPYVEPGQIVALRKDHQWALTEPFKITPRTPGLSRSGELLCPLPKPWISQPLS